MSHTADVIMPIRNGAPFVVPALESILADPCLGTLIIVDDGSDDGWEAFAAPLLATPHRPTIVLRQKSSGVAAALNRGLAASSATYVARMDADDISLPGRLSAQAAWLDRHPHIAALGTQVTFIGATDAKGRHSRYPTTPEALRHDLFTRGRCAVSHPSVMLRRDAVIAAGGYRETFLHAEDYDLWLRLSEREQVANLPDRFLQYRLHPGQISETHKVRQSFSRDLALLAARERAPGTPDAAIACLAALPYSHLRAASHPVVRALAITYHAIDAIQKGGTQVLAYEAIRAIPALARQAYLGEGRRTRYDLIRMAGAAALRTGNIADAFDAYCALARCRTADSRLFRTRHAEAV